MFEGFEISNGKITVTDVETGQVVDRPDIAALGLGVFTDAIEAAGGEIIGSVTVIAPTRNLSLVRDDDPAS